MQELRGPLLLLLSGIGLFAAQDASAGTYFSCTKYPGGTVVVEGQSFPQPDIIDCEMFDDGMGNGGYGDPYAGSGTGGGSGTSPNVFPKATNHPQQTYPANCRSDQNTRYLHAANDVAFTNARRLATGSGLLKRGALVQVEYDDGGTERWQVTDPLMSIPIAPNPVAGTLVCP